MSYSYDDIYVLHAWRDNRRRLTLTQGEGYSGTLSGEYMVKAPHFQLVDERGVISIPSDTAVSMAITLPNGAEDLIACYPVDKPNGVFCCPIRTTMTSQYGEVKGEVRLTTASNTVVKFYGVVFCVKRGVSDSAAEQAPAFSALVEALSKVEAVTPSGATIAPLDETIQENGQHPVASGIIYDYLVDKYYTKTQSDDRYYQKSQVYTKVESDEAAAGVVDTIILGEHESSASLELQNGELVYVATDGTVKPLGDAKDTFYTKTQIDIALGTKAGVATTLAGYGITDGMKYVEIDGNDPTSVDSCTAQNTLYKVYIESDVATHSNYSLICITSSTKKVQYAFTRHGFIIYRGKSGDDDWEDWDYLPTHSLMSKAIREAVISGFFGIETDSTLDKTYNVHNADVDSYYNKTPYTNDNFEHSHIDESFETLTVSRADRPNTLSLDRPSGATKIVFRDTITQKEWSETVSSSTFDVKNLIPSHLYYYTFYNLSNKVLQAGKISPSGQIRMIDAGGNTFNIRDLGGWTCDGGKLKYGLIYRGCRLNGTDITLTSSQILFFKDTLGIRDEIDLRSDSNATGITDTALGIGVDYVRKPLSYYQNSISADGHKYAFLIKRIAQNVKEGKVSYIHCASGADRTAQLCMMIETVCGVTQSNLDRDYELNSFAYETDNSRLYSRRRNTSTNADWKTFIGVIDNAEMDGTGLKDKVIRYLIRNGVTIDEINTLRDCLIDGEPEKISAPYSTATVTKNLTNIIVDNQDTVVTLYQPYTATVFVNSSCVLQSLTVTMGGTDITSTAVNNGAINIPIVTGNIVITGVAQSVQSYVKNYTLPTSYWSSGAQPVTITGYNLTANTRVDTDITPTANTQLIADDCAGIYVEQNVVNDTVVLTAKYIGNKPTADVVVQLTLTEVVRGD